VAPYSTDLVAIKNAGLGSWRVRMRILGISSASGGFNPPFCLQLETGKGNKKMEQNLSQD